MKQIAILWISAQTATITSNRDGDQIVKIAGPIVDLRDRSDLDFMLDVSNSKIGVLTLDVILDNDAGGTLPAVSVPVNLVGNVSIDKKTKLTTVRLSCTRDALRECGLNADMLLDAGLRLDCRFEEVKENEDQVGLFDEGGEAE